MPDDSVEETKPAEDAETAPTDSDYTAFEKWKYDHVFYKETASPKSWLDLAESFYMASHILVEGVAKDALNEDIEGIAGLFLFRHYLELALKQIVYAGRWLTKDGENAPRQEVTPVQKTHILKKLWELVLSDVKPKLKDYWDNYDVDFVEN